MNSRTEIYLVALLIMLLSACFTVTKEETIPVSCVKSQFKSLEINFIENETKSTKKDAVSVLNLNDDFYLSMIPSQEWCYGFFPGSFRLGSVFTGDKDQPAKTLTTRFNEKTGALRSWDHNSDNLQFPVTIDNIMNLELLFRTYRHTDDLHYYNITIRHTATILTNLERNYSCESGQSKGFLWGHSTGSFPQKTEVCVPVNFADYCYLEGLLRQKFFDNILLLT